MEDHSQEMSQISDRLIDAEVAAEQKRKKADRERQKAEEESQRAEEERQRAEQERKRAKQERKRAEEERMSFVAKESLFPEERDLLLRKKEEELLEQQMKLDLFLEEKGKWMKQRNHLEKELAKYKRRAEENLFPDTSSMAFSNEAGFSKPLHSSPAINPAPSSLAPTLDTASIVKNQLLLEWLDVQLAPKEIRPATTRMEP